MLMTDIRKCEYISWNRFYRLSATLYQRIAAAGFRPDTIVGIARGGYMPARVLADFFDLMDLAVVKVEHYHGPEKSTKAVVRHRLTADIAEKRVLLVDDVSDSGDTFDAALTHLDEHGPPAEIRTAVLHHKLTSTYRPDFYAARVVKWRWIIYPWALTEDLRALLGEMSPRPRTVDNARSALRAHHRLDVPRKILVMLHENLGLTSRQA